MIIIFSINQGKAFTFHEQYNINIVLWPLKESIIRYNEIGRRRCIWWMFLLSNSVIWSFLLRQVCLTIALFIWIHTIKLLRHNIWAPISTSSIIYCVFWLKCIPNLYFGNMKNRFKKPFYLKWKPFRISHVINVQAKHGVYFISKCETTAINKFESLCRCMLVMWTSHAPHWHFPVWQIQHQHVSEKQWLIGRVYHHCWLYAD